MFNEGGLFGRGKNTQEPGELPQVEVRGRTIRNFPREVALDAFKHKRYIPFDYRKGHDPRLEYDVQHGLFRSKFSRYSKAHVALVNGEWYLSEDNFRAEQQTRAEAAAGEDDVIVYPEDWRDYEALVDGLQILKYYFQAVGEADPHGRLPNIDLRHFNYWRFEPNGNPENATIENAREYDPEMFDGPEVPQKVINFLKEGNYYMLGYHGMAAHRIAPTEDSSVNATDGGSRGCGWMTKDGKTFFHAPESILYYLEEHGCQPSDPNFLAFVEAVMTDNIQPYEPAKRQDHDDDEW